MTSKFETRRPLDRRMVNAPRKPIPRANQPAAEGASASEEVARYVADMTLQLATMASGAKLDLLAYFLNMAHAESVAMARNPPDAARD
jgi:hypothetical protein